MTAPSETFGSPHGWPSTMPEEYLRELVDLGTNYRAASVEATLYALRSLMRGESVPGWHDPHECWQAVNLAVMQTKKAAASEKWVAGRDARVVSAVHRLLFAAGQRKTLQTADLRAAVDGQ